MNDTPAIKIEDVYKSYPVFSHPWKAVRYLASLIKCGVSDKKNVEASVEALRDISLSVCRGERVGIIGRNGAGKSTLLKHLAGGFPPDAGHMIVNGNLYCLLPGSVSFSLEQSIEENARQYLSYLGLKQNEMEARIDDIREFTELGEYFFQPTKNLSLGMRVRAEFAVATAQSAEILIIDEVLGAGDIYWSEKIARRMETLCAEGKTLLLVSHSLSQINRYCKRAVWIERGMIVMDGPALEVTKRYEGFLERLSWKTDDIDDKQLELENVASNMGTEVLPESGQEVVRWPGRGDVYITGLWVNGQNKTSITINESEKLEVRFSVRAKVKGNYKLRYLITIWNENGKRFAAAENLVDDVVFDENYQHDVIFSYNQIEIEPSEYQLSLGIFDAKMAANTTSEFACRMDVLWKSVRLSVNATRRCSPHPKFRIKLS